MTAAIYSVDGQGFTSYFAAIKKAKELNVAVIEIENGAVRWEPIPDVSAKRMSRYKRQKAAYEAANRHGLA